MLPSAEAPRLTNLAVLRTLIRPDRAVFRVAPKRKDNRYFVIGLEDFLFPCGVFGIRVDLLPIRAPRVLRPNFDVPDQERIINSMTDSELAGIIAELYVDDAVDMMEELPANVVKRVMRTATPQTRALINQYLHYPEDSAGSIMTAEFIDLKKYMSVKESFARIRRIGEDKETIYI